jgi:mono/diheme cytochrome c family protein
METRLVKLEIAVAGATVTILTALLFFFVVSAIAAEEGTAALKNPYEGQADVVAEGGSLFNQYCSHCHGPYAVQGERPRDLRRLTIRYGDDAINLFWVTINNGRMEKGMPVWKEAISDDIKWRIYTFLQSVQTK